MFKQVSNGVFAHAVVVADPEVLILTDIENLCGGSKKVSAPLCKQVRRSLRQIVNSNNVLTVVASGPKARGRVPSLKSIVGAKHLLVAGGVDGADKALLNYAASHPAVRCKTVVIASGDAAFAPLARLLKQSGVRVVLFAGRSSCASKLRDTADEVHYFTPFQVIDGQGAHGKARS